MLPTGIEATTESEVEKTAYGVNDLTEKLGEAKAAFALVVVVDTCLRQRQIDPVCRFPLNQHDDLPVAGRGMATAKGGSVKRRCQQSGGPQAIDRAGRLLMPRAMSAPSG
jgi:hypothetical protein